MFYLSKKCKPKPPDYSLTYWIIRSGAVGNSLSFHQPDILPLSGKTGSFLTNLLACNYVNEWLVKEKILNYHYFAEGILGADREKPAMFLLRRNPLAFFMRSIQKEIHETPINN